MSGAWDGVGNSTDAYGLRRADAYYSLSSAGSPVGLLGPAGTVITDPNSAAASTTTSAIASNLRPSNIITLDSALTLSLQASGTTADITVVFIQDSFGGWPVVWPTVTWQGGTAPVPNATPGSTSTFRFVTVDSGTTWYGMQLPNATGTYSAFDRFTRTDSNSTMSSAETGGAWTVNGAGSPVMGISSNQAYVVTKASSGLTVATLDLTGKGDFTMYADLIMGATRSDAALIFRGDATNPHTTCMQLYYYEFGNALQLYGTIAGTPTQVGSDLTLTAAVNTTYRIKIVASGTSVTIAAKGTNGAIAASTVFTLNSAAKGSGITANVKHGIALPAAGTAANVRFDNLVLY